MKPIDKDELYEHLSNFLRSKGIDLKQGSYTHGIQKSCSLLTDAINLSQSGLKKAKNQIDQKLDQMRQVIHEKTAPNPPPAAPPGTSAAIQAASASGQEPPPPVRSAEEPHAANKAGGSPKRSRKGKHPVRKPNHG
jgi:hypothetical protein